MLQMTFNITRKYYPIIIVDSTKFLTVPPPKIEDIAAAKEKDAPCRPKGVLTN